MMNAPAPMIGGMSGPPVEAAASTPAANRGVNPARFISGMVITPVVTTLATEEPEIEPIRPEASTATWPGPADEAAGGDAREVDHEVAGARAQQEGAEQHEHVDVGRGDLRDRPEHAVQPVVAAVEHGLPGEAGEVEHAARVLAPPGDVGDRNHGHDRDGQPRGPARELDREQHRDRAEHPVADAEGLAAVVQGLLEQDQIDRRGQGEQAEDEVEPEHGLPDAGTARPPGRVHERPHEGEAAEMERRDPELGQRRDGVEVDVGERDDDARAGHQPAEARAQLIGRRRLVGIGGEARHRARDGARRGRRGLHRSALRPAASAGRGPRCPAPRRSAARPDAAASAGRRAPSRAPCPWSRRGCSAGTAGSRTSSW